MSKHILKDLEELTAAGVMSTGDADRIRSYYLQKSADSPNRLILIFAVFGGLLTGLGVVLIIAHNWDDFSRGVKIAFALLPLLIGQVLCGFTLLKHPGSKSWREASAVFLFFAIASSIAIVSQVYNIPGNFSGFLLTWMILSVALIYVMRSSMTFLLVICGITTYACTVSYFDYPVEIAWYYWLVVACIFPFHFFASRNGHSRFTYFHRWFLAISAAITLNMFNVSDSEFMWVAYVSFFCLLILIGDSEHRAGEKIVNNAYLIIGTLGLAFVLILLSFRFVWNEIADEMEAVDEPFFASALITMVAVGVLIYRIRQVGMSSINPNAYIFLMFPVLFLLGTVEPVISHWLVNVLILAMAVVTTWRGAERDSMLILNFGLLIMAVLILCRFFDTDMSFVVRGILFLVVGASFFCANYWVLRRRKLQNL